MAVDKINLICACPLRDEFREKVLNSEAFKDYYEEKEEYHYLFQKRHCILPKSKEYFLAENLEQLSFLNFFSCNPDRIGLARMYDILKEIFLVDSMEKFRITRMDFNVDIEIPTSKLLEKIYMS